MLPVAYDPILVVASVLVAIMASYTGLRLTSGLRYRRLAARKQEVAKAAVALGGGIWSMHFVGMLAVKIPVAIQYDALATLGSVLVAILVTGLGLLVLHIGKRSWRRIVVAGVLTGLGIVSMHYIGMSAIGGNCVVAYEPAGFVLSTAIAVGSSIAALWLAYTKRTLAQIAAGSVLLGITIASMHYSAMIYTRFSLATEITLIEEPYLSTGVLALVVAVAAFLICGLFLLTAIPSGGTADTPEPHVEGPPAEPAGGPAPEHRQDTAPTAPMPIPQEPLDEAPINRLPYEANQVTLFIATNDVHAIRADGHYTRLYNAAGEVFCPWPISRVATTLADGAFIRTHRSYLVNLRHVQGFERTGDKAFCLVGQAGDTKIPVSRSRVHEVRRVLGLQ